MYTLFILSPNKNNNFVLSFNQKFITMLKQGITILFMISTIYASAQSKKEQDQAAIKSMCGCYEVGFNFAETFHYSEDPNYQPSETKHMGGLEWVQLVEDTEDKIVLQHLLIVGEAEAPYIIKHWRQDWLFENTDLYMYDVNNRWKFVQLPNSDVSGQWTQKVFQVDDSPRYEGSASWVHVDGKSFWENMTNAPLPRREYTKRDDYNVTLRMNRHEITEDGWIHNQDNKKIIREAGKEDFVLAEEKGYNTYKKVEDARCQAAQDWWVENQVMWQKVRSIWDTVFGRQQDLELTLKVEEKRLYEYLFEMETSASDAKLEETINLFVQK